MYIEEEDTVCVECWNFGKRVPGRVLCPECDRVMSQLPRFRQAIEGVSLPSKPEHWSVESFSFYEARWLTLEEFPARIQKYVEGQAEKGGCLIKGSIGGRIKYMHRRVYEAKNSNNSRRLVRC